MESLAFNIMARIDDVLYVDDTAKRLSSDSNPIQKQVFSIGDMLYSSPFATPTFCSSPPIPGSPCRVQMPIQSNGLKHVPDQKVNISMPDLEKILSYVENLSGRRITGDAPERF